MNANMNIFKERLVPVSQSEITSRLFLFAKMKQCVYSIKLIGIAVPQTWTLITIFSIMIIMILYFQRQAEV